MSTFTNAAHCTQNVSFSTIKTKKISNWQCNLRILLPPIDKLMTPIYWTVVRLANITYVTNNLIVDVMTTHRVQEKNCFTTHTSTNLMINPHHYRTMSNVTNCSPFLVQFGKPNQFFFLIWQNSDSASTDIDREEKPKNFNKKLKKTCSNVRAIVLKWTLLSEHFIFETAFTTINLVSRSLNNSDYTKCDVLGNEFSYLNWIMKAHIYIHINIRTRVSVYIHTAHLGLYVVRFTYKMVIVAHLYLIG